MGKEYLRILQKLKWSSTGSIVLVTFILDEIKISHLKIYHESNQKSGKTTRYLRY